MLNFRGQVQTSGSDMEECLVTLDNFQVLVSVSPLRWELGLRAH